MLLVEILMSYAIIILRQMKLLIAKKKVILQIVNLTVQRSFFILFGIVFSELRITRLFLIENVMTKNAMTADFYMLAKC